MKFIFIYNISLVCWQINFRSSLWRCSVEKAVFKNFAKSTGKHLCQNFLLIKFFARCFKTRFVQNTSGRRLLWTAASEISNTKYLKLIEKISIVQEKNIHGNVLWVLTNEKKKKKLKPMRVWLWLVYKYTKKCQIYRFFSEFIQTKKKYPSSLRKIRILTLNLLVTSS